MTHLTTVIGKIPRSSSSASPLALASLANAATVGPAAALTGPVSRGDHGIIQNHLDAMQDLPETTRATYKALLESARWVAEESSSE